MKEGKHGAQRPQPVGLPSYTCSPQSATCSLQTALTPQLKPAYGKDTIKSNGIEDLYVSG